MTLAKELENKIKELMFEIGKYIKDKKVTVVLGSVFVDMEKYEVKYWSVIYGEIDVIQNGISLTEDATDEDLEKIYEKVFDELSWKYGSQIEKEKQARQKNILNFIEEE